MLKEAGKDAHEIASLIRAKHHLDGHEFLGESNVRYILKKFPPLAGAQATTVKTVSIPIPVSLDEAEAMIAVAKAYIRRAERRPE